MKSLYNITTEFAEIMQEIEANEGEITPIYEAALEIVEDELEQKATNYVEFIGDRTAFIARIDEEVKRLQALKKANKNLIERLKNNLLSAVLQFGDFTITKGLKKFTTRKSQSLIIEDETKVPGKFQIVETKPNKAAIKAAIKAGETVAGCYIQDNKNLSIK